MAPKRPTCQTPGCDGEAFAMSPICTRCFVAQPVRDRVPPVPAGCDLRSFPDMPVDVIKLHGSDMHLEVTPEEGWYAFQLWMRSWHTVPAASLANDDKKLALAAGLGRDTRTWKKVRAGAIRGFVECRDGRLYHLVLADKACNAWDIKKGRQRGAHLTNSRSRNGQDVDNEGNDPRTADRSIYKERTGERSAPGPQSDGEAPRSTSATEKRREENQLQLSSSSGTARATAPEQTRSVPELAIPLGQKLITACGYTEAEVPEFSKVMSWLNAGLKPQEIEASIPVIAERIRALPQRPRVLLSYVDGMMREEVAKMRNGIGSAPAPHPTSTSDADMNRMRNRARHFVKTGKWDEERWGARDLVPANIWAEVNAELATSHKGAA